MSGSGSVPAASRRLLVLGEMGPGSPSTRYRALQHVPRLRERFAAVEVSLPRDPVTRAPGRIAQARSFATHAARYTERGLGLPGRLRRSDALLVQRGLYPLGPGTIVAPLRGYPGRVVLDLDDAVFEPHPELAAKGALARWLYGGQQARRLLDRADAIVVSSQRLAEMLPDNVEAAVVLPTVPDVSAHRPVAHDDRPVVIGWAGTPGGIGFLDPLAPVFARLATEAVARLEVVSSRAWDGPAAFHRWRLAEETTVFNRFSIGIMPLPDTPYTRAKAGFKLLQYMASGLPVVSSPVGVNVELIERSQAGFLAATPAEWEQALRRLATDPALRSRMGASGRAFVSRYGDLDRQAQILTDLLAGSAR